MTADRREFLRLAAPGVVAGLAGCLSGPTDGANGSDGTETAIEAVDTVPL
ncbi:MAG: hypothetical protein ACI944_002133, partial [Natronomonas sp.]